MLNAIRVLAGLITFAASVYGMARACYGEISCAKTANPTVISEYPATVTYTVTFSYNWPGDQCAVGWLTDSLLPSGYFTLPENPDPNDPATLWVSNPPNGTAFRTYTISLENYNDCKAKALPEVPGPDGAVSLTNLLSGAEYGPFAASFTCQTAVTCKPPPVGHGCTLTPGYWKTHSLFGPAPYNDTWAILPDGASTLFFLSGQTYFEALWTEPSGGNAYYILAHAYIAAVLNIADGASAPDEVMDGIAFAENFFAVNLPTTKLTKAQRSMAIAWATILDNYNNGRIGPGHCAE